jgi:hypothetical protein
VVLAEGPQCTAHGPDVSQTPAADVREAGRRALIESGARKEIAMMVTNESCSPYSGRASTPSVPSGTYG